MPRKTKSAVTLFPYCVDPSGTKHYLVLKRSADKSIDPNLVNGTIFSATAWMKDGGAVVEKITISRIPVK